MIKQLRLTKAVIIVILGIVALIAAKIMEEYKVEGDEVVLGISGALLMVGALIFLYPILFAKKADRDGKKVELQPVASEPAEEDDMAI